MLSNDISVHHIVLNRRDQDVVKLDFSAVRSIQAKRRSGEVLEETLDNQSRRKCVPQQDYMQFSGQFRLFVDRFYQFLNPDFSVKLPKGKKAIIIGSQGNPDPKTFDAVYKNLDGVLKMNGFNVVGELRMSAGNPPSAVKEREDLLAEARGLGKNL